MANEGTLQVNFRSTVASAPIATSTVSSTFDIAGTNANAGETANIDSDDEITFAEGLDNTTLGTVGIMHTGVDETGTATTATLKLSYGTSAFAAGYQFATLKPGELLVWHPLFPTSQTKIFGSASTGQVKVRKFAAQL